MVDKHTDVDVIASSRLAIYPVLSVEFLRTEGTLLCCFGGVESRRF